jgi:hypothetical protein
MHLLCSPCSPCKHVFEGLRGTSERSNQPRKMAEPFQRRQHILCSHDYYEYITRGVWLCFMGTFGIASPELDIHILFALENCVLASRELWSECFTAVLVGTTNYTSSINVIIIGPLLQHTIVNHIPASTVPSIRIVPLISHWHMDAASAVDA